MTDTITQSRRDAIGPWPIRPFADAVQAVCQALSERGPNREVYVSVYPTSHVVRQNYPVIGIRTDGDVLFVDTATEPVEGAGQ